MGLGLDVFLVFQRGSGCVGAAGPAPGARRLVPARRGARHRGDAARGLPPLLRLQPGRALLADRGQ